MPVEAVQVLHGGGEIGALLSAAPEVGVISFTGSPATGNAVARAAGAKRLVMELGGALSISSTPGHGSMVEAAIPLEEWSGWKRTA